MINKSGRQYLTNRLAILLALLFSNFSVMQSRLLPDLHPHLAVQGHPLLQLGRRGQNQLGHQGLPELSDTLSLRCPLFLLPCQPGPEGPDLQRVQAGGGQAALQILQVIRHSPLVPLWRRLLLCAPRRQRPDLQGEPAVEPTAATPPHTDGRDSQQCLFAGSGRVL